jgi:hypothetical protein
MAGRQPPAVRAGRAGLSHVWIFAGFPPVFRDACRGSHPRAPGRQEHREILGPIHWLAIVGEVGPDPESVTPITRLALRDG